LQRLNDDLLTGSTPFYGYDHSDHLRFAYQAQAGYVLARVNRAPLGTLRTLYDNERDKAITPLPVLYLGLALDMQGDHARGRKAIVEAFAKKNERPEYLGDYGTTIRDEALIVIFNEHWRARIGGISGTAIGETHEESEQKRRTEQPKIGSLLAQEEPEVIAGDEENPFHPRVPCERFLWRTALASAARIAPAAASLATTKTAPM